MKGDPRNSTSKANVALCTLQRNAIITVAGNVAYSAAQAGVMISIARFGGPESLGKFSLGLALTAPVVMCANMQLRSVQSSDARAGFPFGTYFAVRLIMSFVAAVVILALAWLPDYSTSTSLVISGVGLAKLVESFSDLCYGAHQHREDMKPISLSLVTRGIGELVVVTGVLIWTQSVVLSTFSLAAVWALILFSFDRRQMLRIAATARRELAPDWSRAEMFRLFRLAAPLGLAALFISLNTNLPRYFVGRYLGEHDLGVFAAFAYLTVAGSTIISALGHSSMPRMAHLYSTGQVGAYTALASRLCGGVVIVTSIGFVIAVAAGKPLTRVVFGPDFEQETSVLLSVIAWAGTTLLASTLTFCASAVRRFDIQTPIAIAAAATTALASITLVPRYGIAGAAWAALVGSGVHACANAATIFHSIVLFKRSSPTQKLASVG